MAAANVTGIIPAAGRAARMGTLPCSKEILPLGVSTSPHGEARLHVLCECLLDEYKRAGIRRIVIATRTSKDDIARYLGNGDRFGVDISYVYVDSPNTPSSVAAALAQVGLGSAAVGFPDIVYGADNAYRKLCHLLELQNADVVLGLYPTRYPTMVDMVRVSDDGRVRDILIKPKTLPQDVQYSWLTAVWNATFSAFLNHNVEQLTQTKAAQGQELYLGDVVVCALEQGLRVYATNVSSAVCLDAGTPQTYQEALLEFAQVRVSSTTANNNLVDTED